MSLELGRGGEAEGGGPPGAGHQSDQRRVHGQQGEGSHTPVHHRLARHQICADELLEHISPLHITSTDMSLLPAHTNTHIPDGVRRIRGSTWSEYRPLLDADYHAARAHLLHVNLHSREYTGLVGRVAQDEGHQDEDRGPAPFGPRPVLLVALGFVRLLRGQFSSRRLSVSAVLRGGP